jgi:hypothetical protein
MAALVYSCTIYHMLKSWTSALGFTSQTSMHIKVGIRGQEIQVISISYLTYPFLTNFLASASHWAS